VLFKLVGTRSNKAAIGAGHGEGGSLGQFDEVRGGARYRSQLDLRLHFGLGAKDTMSKVGIRCRLGK